MTESVGTDQLDQVLSSPQRDGGRISEVANPGTGEEESHSPSQMSKHQKKLTNTKSVQNPGNKSMTRALVNSSVMNPREGEGKLDERLGAFELCSYKLEAYPDEKITYVKFLDDNDPSLLLVVTYDELSATSYMKVMKIQSIVKKPAAKSGEPGLDNGGNFLRADSNFPSRLDAERRPTFTTLDEAPITNLKQQLIAKQGETDKKNTQ
jgi:hypothetical protein